MKKGYTALKLRIRMQQPVLFPLSILCNIIIFCYSGYIAFCIRKVLNAVQDGSARNYTTTVLPWLAGFAAAGVIRVLVIKLSAVLDSVISFEAENTLRHNIFLLTQKRRNILSVSSQSNKIYEAMDDDVPKCVFPATLLSEVLGYVGYTITAIVTLLVINWQVTVFIFIPLSLAILFVQFLSNRLKSNRLSNRQIHEQITDTVAHISSMARIIKLAGSEDQILHYYDSLNASRRKIMKKDKFLDSITRAATGSTVYVGTAIMMFMMAESMMAGKFTLGDFSIFITYLGTLADCVNRIIELVTESHQAEVSFERITKAAGEDKPALLMAHPYIYAFKKEPPFTPASSQRIRLKDLSIQNLNYQNVIENISFHMKQGELLVLCGEVGSGKSTIASVITGMLPMDSGQMFWNGQPFKELGLTSPNIVFTPQNPGIFSTSIRDNILLGYSASEQEMNKAIHDAVFESDLSKMEQGLDTLAGSRGDQLSGGQKQRLALARMFVRNPELYVLDDSTSALDAATEREFVKRLLLRIKEQHCACIAVTNRKGLLSSADQILVLQSGQIQATGTADTLVHQNEYFQKIYGIS